MLLPDYQTNSSQKLPTNKFNTTTYGLNNKYNALKKPDSETLKSPMPMLPYKKDKPLQTHATHKKSEPYKIMKSPKTICPKTETFQLKLKKPEEEKLTPSFPPLKFTL